MSMHSVLSHHDPSDPNFSAHIVKINGNAICIGCTASKIFMHAILPLLLVSFGYLAYWTGLEFLLLGLFISSLAISGRELLVGTPIGNKWLNMIPGLFQLSSLIYVASLSSVLSLDFRLTIAFLLSLPQIGIYTFKIAKGKEYHNSGIKLGFRTLMIIGLFFATIDLFATPLLSSLFIVASGILFIKLRKFSSYRAGNDKIPVFHSFSRYLTENLQKNNIIDQEGILLLRNNLWIFVLFFIGVVSLVSNNPSTCDTSVASAATISVPFLALSSTNFCPNCGDPVDFNEKFCDKCGYDISQGQGGQNKTNYQNNQQGRQNYSGGYNQGSSGGGGYYRGNRRRNYSRDEAMGPAIAAAVVILLIGWGFTGSLGLGILVGALAFGGIMLAASTDNCCAQYLIMDCCCDCICSIMASGANNRR